MAQSCCSSQVYAAHVLSSYTPVITFGKGSSLQDVFFTCSPTVSSTLRSLSAVYREQGRVETAQELDKLTGEKVLNKSQRDRIAELLSATSEASDSPSPSPTPSAKMQV